MKIYAIIPARGGSKRVPGKNIKPLLGKPLIAWTIEEAKSVPAISRVIVNTDSDEIADVSLSRGAEVFRRPPELGSDLIDDLAVFLHHLTLLAKLDDLPDIVVDLRATAPLRRAGRIYQGIEILKGLGREGADSVRAVTKASKHPYKMWKLANGYLTSMLPEEYTGMREPYNTVRQVLPPIYQNNGSMNAFWPETVLVKKSMTGERIAGYEMDEWESVNIDTELDFLLAEYLMKRHREKFTKPS